MNKWGSRLSLLLIAVVAMTGCVSTPQRSAAEVEALKRVRFVDSPEGARAVLDNAILFPLDSATLFPQSEGVIDALKPSFAKARGQIIVEGHTDNRGKADYNAKLSQQRADAVKAALVARQVPPARISTRGLGFTKPVNQNAKSEQEHTANRRAEIIFVGETVESIGGKEVEARAQTALEKTGDFFKGLMDRFN